MTQNLLHGQRSDKAPEHITELNESISFINSMLKKYPGVDVYIDEAGKLQITVNGVAI